MASGVVVVVVVLVVLGGYVSGQTDRLKQSLHFHEFHSTVPQAPATAHNNAVRLSAAVSVETSFPSNFAICCSLLMLSRPAKVAVFSCPCGAVARRGTPTTAATSATERADMASCVKSCELKLLPFYRPRFLRLQALHRILCAHDGCMFAASASFCIGPV